MSKLGDISYSPAWRAFANGGMFVIMRLTMELNLVGLDHIPRSGPLLVIINHNSFLDPLLPCVFVRRDVFPMAKAEAMENGFGWMLKWYGAFPVRRGEPDVSALKRALRVLKNGHTLLMAPEGTRNPEGVLQEAHEGAALIAVRSGAPLVPIALSGGVPYLKNLKHARRTSVTMRVGEPLVVRRLEHKPTRDDLRIVTDDMMYSLAALMPPALRGRYADAEQFAPHFLLPYHMASPENEQAQKEVMPLTN